MYNQLKHNGIPSGRTISDVVAGYDVPITALGLPLSFSRMETQTSIKNLDGEIWKPILDYEGLYEVSNKGRVKSLNYGGKKGKVRLLVERVVTPNGKRVASYKLVD